jgi:hypothetical protein
VKSKKQRKNAFKSPMTRDEGKVDPQTANIAV